jgi:signal transduction histidine kinase
MSESSIAVLLVEDNPGDVRLIEEILNEDNSGQFDLDRATDLETALKRLTGGGIDVVLLDLSLPDSQGIDTFNQVHAHSPHVPIVVLTGLMDDAVAAQTLSNGGQDFLNKGPLNLLALQKSIRHAMQRTRAPQSYPVKQAVEVAERVHDEFLAALSHKLRELLTSMRSGIAGLMEAANIDADQRTALAGIRNHVERQARLVDDIRAYARVGMEGKAFGLVECDDIVEGVLDRLKPSMDETRTEVVHKALPTVWGDGAQIGQLFENLIANAMQWRGEAPLRIHVGVDCQGPEWVFSILDNGIGFDPRDDGRLFTIFQTLRDGDEDPGTGAGLAICKKIVERHGGRIWAESQPGQGSCIFFTLLAKADDAVA